jgi:stress-induced-phosphoprotein 1
LNPLALFCSNRGAAYTKVTDFVRGRNDCEKALELNPQYVKAFSRLGAIQFFMKEYHKVYLLPALFVLRLYGVRKGFIYVYMKSIIFQALDSYKSGLNIDPDNEECREGLARVQYAIQSAAQQPADKERAAHAMADPEIQVGFRMLSN